MKNMAVSIRSLRAERFFGFFTANFRQHTGGAYVAHFAMYATLENRTYGKSGPMCATPII
jgi:hypothetical protein